MRHKIHLCSYLFFNVFVILVLADSGFFFDWIIFGLFFTLHVSQLTLVIIGRWSEMSTVRMAECIFILRFVDI